MGPLTLAVGGQLRLVSEITWESEHLFAVLHLGLGFPLLHSTLQGRAYSQLKDKLFDAFQQVSGSIRSGQ